MSDALQKELRKFDAERVLPTWDKLVRGQQARFEALNVPAMFVTNDPNDMAVRSSHLHVKRNPGARSHATLPLFPEAASGGECLGRNLALEWGSLETIAHPIPMARLAVCDCCTSSPERDYQGASVSEGTRPTGERGCKSACFICCGGCKVRAVVRVAGGSFPLTVQSYH